MKTQRSSGLTAGLALLTTLSLVIGLAAILPAPADAAAVEAGYKDHSYGTGIGAPTEDKPQSKLWYTDGSWWAGMFVDGPDEYRIHRYNATTHTWTDTGVAVDVRNSSHADYLWDGATNSLYVASVNGDTDADPILVFKLNYNPATDTYSHDSDFGPGGVSVGTGPSETVTIAKDSTGQLWVTFTNPVDPTGTTTTDRNVMVNRSTDAGEHVWGTEFALADGQISDDDISAIIAFGGDSVGVMWSDQNPSAGETFFYFATHSDAAADTTWSTKQASAQGTDAFAEDHINLKLAATNSGDILAVVKTNGGPDHVQMLRRNASTGNWSRHVVVTAQDVTRPQLVVDSTNGRAYVFYTSPENGTGADQAIYYKSAPLSTLAFTATGLGTLFIKDGTNDISDVSTAKHPVTQSMGGILAIASSDTNNSYYHGWISLSGGATPSPSPSGSPSPSPSPGGGDLPFDDIENSPFVNDIVWVHDEGITGGCSVNPPLFCPLNNVTRQQMASFLVRALDLPPTTKDYFTDDNSSIHENDINALFEAGVTGGCAANRFCPTANVTREQMASFLVRGFKLPASSTDYFTDDNNSVHENDIQALRASGVTGGCTTTRYCPLSTVTRGQMAAFLHRALTR